MSIGKGIKISTGFDLNSQSPLDNREVFETIEERDSLPSINLYEGLMCYVKETKKNYQYVDGTWSVFNSGDGGKQIERIAYGDTEPTSEEILLWIDTSNDDSVSDNFTDTLIIELRSAIENLNSEIKSLKSRVAYLEQNGNGNSK